VKSPVNVSYRCVILLGGFFVPDSSIQILAAISVAVLILAALLVAIFKGSRPPRPIPLTPTSPKQATFAAFMSFVCAAILLVTFTSLGPYVSEHLAAPKPLVVLLVGGIAPWFVGIYFAYKAARAGNKVLRAIGASEVLIFLSAATLTLLSR
jgi:hypothetical protein